MGKQRDAGDLRLYDFVLFYPLVTIPLMMYLFPPRYTRPGDPLAALGNDEWEPLKIPSPTGRGLG